MAKSRANRASPSRPYEVLFQMVIGKWISQALGTIVEIGVPEQLAFEATILRALQGTRVLSLMTARGGPGDSLAIA